MCMWQKWKRRSCAKPDAQNTVEWWERVHQDAGEICGKYSSHPLAVEMLAAGLGWMESEMDG